MLITKNFSYAFPKGLASGDVLNVSKLKNFREITLETQNLKPFFTGGKKFGFFRTQMPADFNQTLC